MVQKYGKGTEIWGKGAKRLQVTDITDFLWNIRFTRYRDMGKKVQRYGERCRDMGKKVSE
jgi:hypothetical protein